MIEIIKLFLGVLISSIFAIFSFGLQCCPKYCAMPYMDEHAYQEEFRRVLAPINNPRISIPPTATIAPTNDTVPMDDIRFRTPVPIGDNEVRDDRAPVAEAAEQTSARMTAVEPVRPINT